ncbi:MAG TPA: S41 family peptidase [Parachlamydiaceae bacterium]|nr:S41 family peptidase [Parachlamydiaceae bacterium]
MSRKSPLILAALLFSFLVVPFSHAKLPELTPKNTTEKINEIMKSHATHKKATPVLIKRTLSNFIDELDPTKTYFIESDIHQWLEPSEEFLNKVLQEYNNSSFDTFEQIHDAMITAIKRRHLVEKKIDLEHPPKHVKADEFKDMKWTTSEEDLLTRLSRIKALQSETASKLNEETKEKSLQRIQKRQDKYEEEIENPDPVQKLRYTLVHVLKATSSALDAHTSYFTPEEATQFVINVQQRLFGIGAQLRDDLNGFSVVKIVEGGPAALSKELKVKDRIIAVNGEPVVGMDIIDAVDLIRGEENTPVTLTVIRESGTDDEKKEEKLNIILKRAEVVLKESRYETSFVPYGDGVIGYVRLFSFYQDPGSSSADDISKEITKLKDEHNLKGLVFDLRYNSGGILSQAVSVTGLFITKGVVVSIKDDSGHVQHLRDLDGTTVWDGPLIVLINRASASASEIVAQTLQDYGRALIIGDDRSFGKGSFQTFTLNTTTKNETVNPQGEYKVTRGRYYTVSGKTPQLTGVISDIVVPGPLSESEIGESFGKFPLDNDSIPPSFDDNLDDIPYLQRDKIRLLYKFNLQPRLHIYDAFLEPLKANSALRIENNKGYQEFLKELKKNNDPEVEDDKSEEFGQNDLQLYETYDIMKDLIYFKQIKLPEPSKK